MSERKYHIGNGKGGSLCGQRWGLRKAAKFRGRRGYVSLTLGPFCKAIPVEEVCKNCRRIFTERYAT